MRLSEPPGELGRYFVFTLGATALLHLSIPALGLNFSLSPRSPALYLYLAGLAPPALAAHLLTPRGVRLAFWRSALSIRRSLAACSVAAAAPLGILLAAWLVFISLGGSVRPGFSPESSFGLLALGQLWVVLGEEPGWRGFALPRLEAFLSPRGATLVVAAIWAVWHLPMFFIEGSLQDGASPWAFAASIFAWSAIHTALYHRSRPSVVPNLIFHAGANLTLSIGLTPPRLEPYLIASLLAVGLVVLARLVPNRSPRAGAS